MDERTWRRNTKRRRIQTTTLLQIKKLDEREGKHSSGTIGSIEQK